MGVLEISYQSNVRDFSAISLHIITYQLLSVNIADLAEVK